MLPQTFKVVTTFYCCVSLFFEAYLAQCPTGQFGPNCINECLCNQNLCTETGECRPDVNCKPGFFGYLCQYIDLGFKAKTSHPTLFDQSDTTCLLMNNTMTFVELDNYYSIAFLRFISKTSAVIDLIIIEFNSTVSCSQYRVFIRYPSEWDIFCKVDNAVNKLTIWWLTAARICSIYISGARKVMSVNFQVPYVTVSYRTASTSRTNSTADSTSSGSPSTETISPREVEIKTLVTSSPLPGSSSGAKKTSRLEESTGRQILGVTEENSTFGNTTRNNTMEISSMKNVAKRGLIKSLVFSFCFIVMSLDT
uniref:EGF-like domain-containing protein n=1 Tax=Biomphalaria glabrata TaxID=6526 RepID=A0A2C9KSS6_BIOGL